ncbi:MAG: RNA methyltransferase [Caldilineaceae bacterium]|nr:RNA methyltransferase [Caldilineaceae bacterium]
MIRVPPVTQSPCHLFPPPMAWQICECIDPECAFRFPAEVFDPRRLHCPLCGAETRRMPALDKGAPEVWPQQQDMVNNIAPGMPPIYVILDNLRSTYNVGSIFRTADAVGVPQIHLCGITPTPDHPKVAKTALGAEQTVPWGHHRNALHLADSLHTQGVALWALEVHPVARSLFEAAPPTGPTALIVGSETCGVDPDLLARCDAVYALPMLGHKGSLNVAGAAAVALYHIRFAPK